MKRFDAGAPEALRRGPALLAALFVAVLAWGLSAQPLSARDRTFAVLMFNDLHGHIEAYQKPAGDGKTAEVGGVARMAAAVRAIRGRYGKRVLLVSAGDSVMGPYAALDNGRVFCRVFDAMGVDAATMGNHEFDFGEQALFERLRCSGFPVIESNLTARPGSPLAGAWVSSVILERGGVKFGILGLMTPALPILSLKADGVVVDTDVVRTADTVARRLRNSGADIVIALGHMGLEQDKALAQAVSGIDIICGGHTHDLVPRGEAFVARHSDGRNTIVVQAGSGGEYLGHLELTLRKKKIKSFQWEPIRMSAEVPADPVVTAIVNEYRQQLPGKERLADCLVPLDCTIATVRTREAAAGNLICDAVKARFGVDVVLHNGGGIRGDRVMAAGPVTTADIDTMLPFGNDVVVLTIDGERLRQALELGVAALPGNSAPLLNVAGLRYRVALSQPPMKLAMGPDGKPTGIVEPGNRVESVTVEQPGGGFLPLDPARLYTVAVNSYLASGGDGFIMLAQARSVLQTHEKLSDIVKQHLTDSKTIEPRVEGRIEIVP